MLSKGGMKFSVSFFLLFTLLAAYTRLQADAAVPAGPLIKQVSSLLKWTRSSSKPLISEKNVLQFEDGYLVETVVQGNELGVMPHKILVSPEGELFAVDADMSNIVRITPPLSQYSRARLVAGSFQGYKGHVDGKPSDARFNHPKGVALDDKGNVYVADTSNLAIRKIGESGVTTIAGGKSNIAGYRDGPSEDAKFSTDFDVVYVRSTCSLLVVDRGNAALRQISLNQDDCEHQYSSVSSTDIMMVIGAVLIGYISCMLQQGFGSSLFSKMQGKMHTDTQVDQPMNEKPTLMEPLKENQETGWPSFGQLIADLSKLAFEASGSTLLNLIPFRSTRQNGPENGPTPLKDSLIMPEDEVEPEPEPEPEPPLVHKLRTPIPMLETRRAFSPNGNEKPSEAKPPKMRSTSFKDPSLSTKHRSSRRHEFAEYYGSGESPPYVQVRSKSMKEKPKHRQREKSGEMGFGSSGMESKPVENKPVNYEQAKFDHYNMRSKYGESYHYE